MPNAQAVRRSLVSFLEKMRACDAAIPEDLAEDAAEMVEEVEDALSKDEEADILEVTRDKSACEDKSKDEELEARMEDAFTRVLRKHGIIQDASIHALDKLEEELKEKVGDEEEVKIMDACKDEETEVEKIEDSAAAIREFIREIKPTIAKVSDAKLRSRLSDSVARFARLKMSNTQYSDILSATRKAATDSMTKPAATISDVDHGMSVASRWNPHYKEGK